MLHLTRFLKQEVFEISCVIYIHGGGGCCTGQRRWAPAWKTVGTQHKSLPSDGEGGSAMPFLSVGGSLQACPPSYSETVIRTHVS